MIKFKKILILLAFVLCVSFVSAEHTANVELVNYTSFVETQNTNFSLNVITTGVSDYLKQINISIPTDNLDIIDYNFSDILSCSNYSDLSSNFIINCTNIVGDYNSFSLNLTANILTSSESIPINVYTLDYKLFMLTNVVYLDIYDDTTPPIIEEISPENNTFTNLDSMYFSIDADDSETGIDSGDLSYGECDSSYTSKPLICNENNCSTTLDLNYDHGYDLCYYFTIYNKGGSSSQSSLFLLNIDKEGPIIDDSFLNLINGTNDGDGILEINSSMSSDEAGIKNCSLIVDGTIEDYTNSIGENLTYTMDSSNDPYNFYVECFDNVGNSERTDNYTIYYDKIPPIISNIIATPGTTSATITFDTNEITNVSINYSTDQNELSGQVKRESFLDTHSLTINGLNDSETYYYQISVYDERDNIFTNSILQFTTDAIVINTNPSGGGGGGSSKPSCKEEDWNCTEWSSCSEDGTRTRTCEKLKSCNSITGYDPEIQRTCTYYGTTGISSDTSGDADSVDSSDEGTEFECSDNIDNDNDGKIDEDDPQCIVDGKYTPLRDDEGEGLFGPAVVAIGNGIKTGSKYAAYILIGAVLLSSVYYGYKRKRHPRVKKELIDKVIKEGSFKK